MTGSPAVSTLALNELTIGYDTDGGTIQAVRQVSLSIQPGESFGLVGESGSGKSTLAMGAINYLPDNGKILSGEVRFLGEPLIGRSRDQMAAIWGKAVGVVYQNPLSSLNPSLTIGRQLAEAARVHHPLSRKAAYERALFMLEKIAMPMPGAIARQYPHQLSGGMLQRCVIAMAMMNDPSLLIMDEPTTALDVTTQAVVLDLVAALKADLGATILYITHDLAVVAKVCDRIGVLYAGELLEVGPVREIFHHSLHPYTLSLLGCIPKVNARSRRQSLDSIPGRIPRPDDLPPGCIFAPRCRFVRPECEAAKPPLIEAASGHFTACLRYAHLGEESELVKPDFKSPLTDAQNRLLSIDSLNMHYQVGTGFLSLGEKRKVRAVNGVSLDLKRQFTLGIVGESGCGKTTLIRTIMGLLSPTSGKLVLDGEPLAGSVQHRPKQTLAKLQMVFQNPDASLNPRHTVAQAIQRPMTLLKGVDAAKRVTRTFDLLQAVNLPPEYYNRYPTELSGGEKQRVAIARAFAADPQVVLLDEPLSALDVSVQAALINLLFDLQSAHQTTYLFISHDLAAVQHLSDWIAVMYLGRIMEMGSTEAVFTPPYHPYTEALLSAIPMADPDAAQPHIRLEGAVPSAMAIPPGCPFQTRCPRKVGKICETEAPPNREVEKGHRILCHIPVDELRRMQLAAFEKAGGGRSC
jgi:peptide/nickel transport system ATP-binding protein